MNVHDQLTLAGQLGRTVLVLDRDTLVEGVLQRNPDVRSGYLVRASARLVYFSEPGVDRVERFGVLPCIRLLP